jgi:hypothetical protein
MRNALLVLILVLIGGASQAKEHKTKTKPKDYYKMFSAEASHVYSALISKQGVSAKFYFWANSTYNFGPEFHFYFPAALSTSPDFQLDFNFRKVLVDFHPVTFDVLVGPGFRNYRKNNDERVWSFDGINIGFGLAWRVKNISLYIMPRINHLDPSLQVSTGFKYHFTVTRLLNRYNLRKVRQ